MERRNIMMDEATLAAVAHLQEAYGIATASAAIRYAVFEMAKRSGWKPPKPVAAGRRRQTGGTTDGAD